MQWIFMLVGLAVGASVGESVSAAVLGALVGLGVAQALSLRRLQAENSALSGRLERLVARVEAELAGRGHPPPAADAPAVAPVVEPLATEAGRAADELSWDLELPEQAAPALPAEPAPMAAPPLPDSVASATTTDPWAAAAPSAAERLPRAPSLFARAFAAARDWLLGGNTVLRVGVVLLFLGLAFLLRYASERVVVPVELRYSGVALAAIALLGLGWWLRRRNAAYGLILQGTGIAVLYLTVFAAMRLHPLLSPQAALALLVVVTLCSALLAVLQDALGLAAVAALGGFAAPILTSTGAGDHVALFSYFALLNAGIFAIAWFKAWRLLNLIGFLGTFGIGCAWGLRSYTPELFASTEPFLVLFFLMYVAIGLLFARRRLREAQGLPDMGGREEQLRWSLRQTDYLDGSVLFGTPLVGFGLQVVVIQHIEFGAAFSALALGLFYLGLARLLAGRAPGKALLLVETCLALGVIFGTLAIPLGLDARWTSAAWAVEGAGIYWLGLRQQRPLARIFALLLQVGAALAFLADLRGGADTLLEGAPLGALMLGAALLFSFWQLRRSDPAHLPGWEPKGLPALACAGLAFLYLIAPLCFAVQATAISWALAGLATLFAGLRLRARSFLFAAFAVQLLGGALFLLDLRGGDGGAVLGSGWQGLLGASLIGLALVAGMLIAARDSLVRDDKRLLIGLTLVLLVGLAFVNLAVLFVLPWRTASAVWAGSGLLIVWLGLRLQQRASFVFGLLLQVVGGAAFLLSGPALLAPLPSEGLTPLAHAGFWTPAVLALAALLGAWRLHRAGERERRLALGGVGLEQLSHLLLLWGAGWWALTALCEVARFVSAPLREHVLVLVAALSVVLWALLARREGWRALALLGLALVPAAWLLLASAWRLDYQPLAQLGWLGWPALCAVHLLVLRYLDDLLPPWAARAAHVLGCWLILAVLALELRYLFYALAEHYNAWRWLGWALVPSAFLALMGTARALPWPVAAYPREYRAVAALPVAVLLLGWFWLVNLLSNGSAAPLPYLPLVNPLELGMLIVLAAIFQWSRQGLPRLGLSAERLHRPLQALLGASLFALLTMAVCRTVHHCAGVPFALEALQRSMLVQAGLSLVWTLIALGLMIVGHLRARRELWMLGAILMAVVVAKLFFVELGNSGGLERIVSFIGVGVLMLIVGYFAPLPPRRPDLSQEHPGA
ncbi:hypothetical protein D9M69_224160 [compost metagenome]